MRNQCPNRPNEPKKDRKTQKRLLSLTAFLITILFSFQIRAEGGVGSDLEKILSECKEKENLFTTILPVTPPTIGATLQRMGIANYCQYIQNMVDLQLFIEKGKLSENLLSMTDKHTAENIREMYRFHSFMTSLQDPRDGKFRPESLSQMKNRRRVYGYFRDLGRRVARRQKIEEMEARQANNQKLAELAQKRSILNARNDCLKSDDKDGKKTDYEALYEKEIRPYEREHIYFAYQANAIYRALDVLGQKYLSKGNYGLAADFLTDLRALRNIAVLEASQIKRKENGQDQEWQSFSVNYDGKIARNFVEKYNKYWGAYVNDTPLSGGEELKYIPDLLPEMQSTIEEYFSMGEEDRKNIEDLRAKNKLVKKYGSSGSYAAGERISLFEKMVKLYAQIRNKEESAKANAFTSESKYLKEPIFNLEDGKYISKSPKPCDPGYEKSNWDRAKIDLESKKLEAEYKEIQAQSKFTIHTIRSGRKAADEEFVRKQNSEIEAGNKASQKDIWNNMKLLNGAVNK